MKLKRSLAYIAAAMLCLMCLLTGCGPAGSTATESPQPATPTATAQEPVQPPTPVSLNGAEETPAAAPVEAETALATETPSGDLTPEEQEIVDMMINRPMEHFTLQDTEGNSINTEDLQGNILVINFWASWCGPCMQEMPLFNELAQTTEGENVRILLVNTDDGEAAKQVKQELGLTPDVLIDTDGAVFSTPKYTSRYIPVTYIADETGVIRLMQVGAFASVDDIKQMIEWVRDYAQYAS